MEGRFYRCTESRPREARDDRQTNHYKTDTTTCIIKKGMGVEEEEEG